jgi:hypothetical protein
MVAIREVQPNAAQRHPRRTRQARWSSVNRSGPLCPELLMRHTIQHRSTATAPDSRQPARPPAHRARWDDGQTPSGAASSGRRGRRARCVPDRRSACGYSRSLMVRPSRSPQVAESPGGRQAAPQTSQADSAGSIPVTRSSLKAQVRRFAARPGLASRGHQIPSGPLARGDQHAARTVLIVASPRLHPLTRGLAPARTMDQSSTVSGPAAAVLGSTLCRP